MPSIKIENPFLVSCLNSPWTSSKRSLFSQSKRLQPIDSPPSTSMGFGGPCYAGLSHPRRSKNSECSNCQVPGSRAVAHEPMKGMMIGWKHFGKFHIRKLRLGFFSGIMFQQQMDRFFGISWKKNWSLEHSAVNLLITSFLFEILFRLQQQLHTLFLEDAMILYATLKSPSSVDKPLGLTNHRRMRPAKPIIISSSEVVTGRGCWNLGTLLGAATWRFSEEQIYMWSKIILGLVDRLRIYKKP